MNSFDYRFIFQRWISLLATLLVSLCLSQAREVPKPMANHPGNIFLAGEEVIVPFPPGQSADWLVLDYNGKIVATGPVADQKVHLGQLPVGYYVLSRTGTNLTFNGQTSIAVLAPLKMPTPDTSPIGLDIAMAWFYPEEKMPVVANLCALAGINWVRDRLNWAEMQPARNQFYPETSSGNAGPQPRSKAQRYDVSARVQSEAGLRVLQVNHLSPAWASPSSARFPLDLRDAYRFYEAMARRWQGQVLAFEPWNEADIDMFGGHTGSEMASLQKASYLGLKQGHPGIIACQNVFALHNQAILADFQANQVWPYFDTFNLHHYASLDSYPGLYADFRAVSAGKPLWVTECNIPVHWSGDTTLKEPSPSDLRIQAERVAQIFAATIYEGSAATFYFMLPHYVEGQTQFGVLRPDLTPRPAFLSLAAAGRLLADAKPLGRFPPGEMQKRGYLFQARPDGQLRDVLVAWTAKGMASYEAPVKPEAIYHHLGRSIAVTNQNLVLTPAPVFVVFPAGTTARFGLPSPPKSPDQLSGHASPVVLQALWPKERINLNRSAYRLMANKAETIPIYAYNFGENTMNGRFHVRSPIHWKVVFPESVSLAPGARVRLDLGVDCQRLTNPAVQTIFIEGQFDGEDKPVLSLQVKPELDLVSGGVETQIIGADEPTRWIPNVSGGAAAQVNRTEHGVTILAQPTTTDRWIYPQFTLNADERLQDQCTAVRVTLSLLEGKGDFRMIFEEDNGSSYIADFKVQPKPGATVETSLLIEEAVWGANWSANDPNLKLDLSHVKAVRIGCNTKEDRVKFALKNLRWVKF